MTELLDTYLNIRKAQHQRQDINELARKIPNDHAYMSNGKLTSIKELLLTETIESTTLIQAEAQKTLVEGAKIANCWRDAIPVIRMNTNVVNYPVGGSNTYAPEIAESAVIPISQQNYTSVQFSAKKYGGRPLITNELIEDGIFDIGAQEVKFMGEALENTLNQQAVSKFADSAGLEHDAEGTDIGQKSIADAMAKVRNAGYYPDTLIMHPEAEAALVKELALSDYIGAAEAYKTGTVPGLYRLKTYVCGAEALSSATQTWGYAANGEIGMLVLDSRRAGAIGMRRDITVEQYTDPVRDALGFACTMRFDVEVLAADAICRIEY